MLSFLIILALAYFFYAGARRGLLLQLVHVAGYVLSLLLAAAWYKGLAAKITLLIPYPSATEQSRFVFFDNQVGLTLDDAFYRGVAFVTLLALGWLVTRFVALWLHDLKYRTLDTHLDWLAGGFLNLAMGYLFIFLLLYLVALVPIGGLQDMLEHSLLGKSMVRYSLGLTNLFTKLWVVG
ncbi:CvpA family protein [Lacticaseibacillus parakribbianus]|uniref:CvpA family protein n=1 Tax=Lacticaseibacillus parakribbianus TaxID=2970927 RepID=UPI0021CB13C0|nr:CvpA family protein [Lacticaseibacillus parakribbianus]